MIERKSRGRNNEIIVDQNDKKDKSWNYLYYLNSYFITLSINNTKISLFVRS